MSEMIGIIWLGTILFYATLYVQVKKEYLKMFFMFLTYIHVLSGLVIAVNYTVASDLATTTGVFETLFTLDMFMGVILLVLVFIFETERGVKMWQKTIETLRGMGT